MKLAAQLSLDNNAFVKGLGGATSAIGGFASKGLGMLASPMAAAIGGIASVGTAVVVMKKAISGAAEMEELQNSFVTLLGSTSEAKKRMEELTKFAAETPFEMPDIAKSSKILQSLTGGALATGDGLRSVGDMAAMAGVPMSELSVTVGRLYSGLTSGKAVGESIARMTELGLMSAETRDKLEKLQKEGKKGAEVWAVAAADFAKYSGEMERKSQGWNGLMSTLGDNINLALSAFGQPIMDSLKPFLKEAISMTDSLVDGAKKFGEKIGEGIAIFGEAFRSGKLTSMLGDALIAGITMGVNFLISGLKYAAELSGNMLIAVFKTIGSGEYWSGLAEGIIGAFQGIQAVLQTILLTPVAYLSASLTKAFDEMKEMASQTAVGRKMFGVEKGYKAESFDTYLQASKDVLLSEAKSNAESSKANLESSFDKLSGSIGKNMADAFKATKFESMDTFSDGGASDRLKESIIDLKKTVDEKKSAETTTESTKTSGATASTSTSESGVAKVEADRLAKIGGFVGGNSNVITDYNRKTADNTAMIASGIERLNNNIERRSSASSSTFAWA